MYYTVVGRYLHSDSKLFTIKPLSTLLIEQVMLFATGCTATSYALFPSVPWQIKQYLYAHSLLLTVG